MIVEGPEIVFGFIVDWANTKLACNERKPLAKSAVHTYYHHALRVHSRKDVIKPKDMTIIFTHLTVDIDEGTQMKAE